MIEYNIIRSKRKTFSITIDKHKNLIIRAPIWANNEHINNLLDEKSKWIQKKFASIDYQNSKRLTHTFEQGDVFPCYGQQFKLVFTDLNDIVLKTDKNLIYINYEYKKYTKELIIKWYKNQAANIIISRVYYLADQMNFKINKVKISNAKSRFGSCTSNRNLNFSWRLIIAPKPIVDYIIVHELAHTVEMNHSKKFWNIVSSILPQYKIFENWLKDNYLLFDF